METGVWPSHSHYSITYKDNIIITIIVITTKAYYF
jgi:hypothetical protein